MTGNSPDDANDTFFRGTNRTSVSNLVQDDTSKGGKKEKKEKKKRYVDSRNRGGKKMLKERKKKREESWKIDERAWIVRETSDIF